MVPMVPDEHASQMQQPAGPSLGWRVGFAAALTLATGIGPFAIGGISALSPFVVAQLGLSRTELGSLATVGFGVAALFSIVGGRASDRFGGRSLVFLGFVFGALAASMMAWAPALSWFWIGAAFAGVAMALANSTTNQLIADHIPAGRRGLLMGVKQSGPPMAYVVVGFTLPPLTLVVGWRGAVLTGVALACAGVWLVWRLVPPSSGSLVAATAPTDKRPSDPMMWWLAIYTFTIGIANQAVLVYGPLYAFQEVGLSATVAGMATGVTGAAAVVARMLWGRVAERGESPMRVLAAVVAMSFVGVVLILVSDRLGGWALWPGLTLFGSSALAANVVVMMVVVRTAGASRLGRASGRVGVGMYVGFAAGPIGFGALVDLTDSYTLGWTVIAVLCLVALTIACLGERQLRTQQTGPT